MKRNLISGALFFVFPLALSARGKKMPEWVTAPSAAYPAAEYFSATGEGESRDEAEINAIRSLSAVFGQSLSGSAAAERKLTQSVSGENSVYTQDSSISQNTLRVISQEDLIGIEVKEFFEDSKKNKWYSLAVMDKAKAADLYAALIDRKNGEIDSLLEKARKEGATFRAYRQIYSAAGIADGNDADIARLTVISPERGARLREKSYSKADLLAAAAELAKKIPVRIEDGAETGGRVAAAFAAVFGEYGFATVSDGGARYSVSGGADFYESDSLDGSRVNVNYSAVYYLTDTQTGEKLLPFEAKGRGQHVDRRRAHDAALKNLEKKIAAEFGGSFKSYLNQLSGE